MRAGKLVKNYETIRARKDGTLVDVSLTVSPIRDSSGSVVGASTIARDIGDRLRYQDQLRYLADHDALTGSGPGGGSSRTRPSRSRAAAATESLLASPTIYAASSVTARSNSPITTRCAFQSASAWV